jgi:hypothetical protein
MADRNMLIRVGCSALLLLAAFPNACLAQRVPGMTEDRRVRVLTTDNASIVGNVVRFAGDTLAIATASGEIQRIPWSAVQAVEASRGKARRIGQSAAIGAGVGATVGLGAVVSCNDSDGFITCRDMAPVLIGGSVLIGSAVGALVGARGPERWERLPIRPGIGMAPTSRGARAFFAMSLPVRE